MSFMTVLLWDEEVSILYPENGIVGSSETFVPKEVRCVIQ
jgi:hypothetical protein